MIASDNTVGCVGIAPNVASALRAVGSPAAQHDSHAILAAIARHGLR